MRRGSLRQRAERLAAVRVPGDQPRDRSAAVRDPHRAGIPSRGDPSARPAGRRDRQRPEPRRDRGGSAGALVRCRLTRVGADHGRAHPVDHRLPPDPATGTPAGGQGHHRRHRRLLRMAAGLRRRRPHAALEAALDVLDRFPSAGPRWRRPPPGGKGAATAPAAGLAIPR